MTVEVEECLCTTCIQEGCNGLYVRSKHPFNPVYTVHECDGYMKEEKVDGRN